MTPKEITAEINRFLELCSMRQLKLVLRVVKVLLK